MDENHQDKTNHNLMATENKIWLPPSYMKEKVPVISTQKKRGVNWGFADRTVFDWTILISQVLGAVAIPFVVTMLGLYLTQQITQQQAILAQKQHVADQQLALDQQRATTLQTYLDNIQDLLLNHHLLAAKPGDDVAILVRARTLTALQELDGSRKGALIQFLYEAHLIGYLDRQNKPQPPVVDLTSADLSSVTFNSTSTDVNIARLVRFGLFHFQREGNGPYLIGASLSGADLNGANLRDARLSGADLEGASLFRVNLFDADLSKAFLNGADLNQADLSGANLSGAVLFRASLSDAVLIGAKLNGADLTEADLSAADLSRADLAGATIVVQVQLSRAKSLAGAIMLDGSKHP